MSEQGSPPRDEPEWRGREIEATEEWNRKEEIRRQETEAAFTRINKEEDESDAELQHRAAMTRLGWWAYGFFVGALAALLAVVYGWLLAEYVR